MIATGVPNPEYRWVREESLRKVVTRDETP